MSLINIGAMIDGLIDIFPGNRKLQEDLGLIIPNHPYESLADIPTEKTSVIGIVRSTFDRRPLNVLPKKMEEEILNLEQSFHKIMFRVIIMALMKESGYSFDGTIDKQLVTAYIELVTPKYAVEILDILDNVREIVGTEISEQYRLQNIIH